MKRFLRFCCSPSAQADQESPDVQELKLDRLQTKSVARADGSTAEPLVHSKESAPSISNTNGVVDAASDTSSVSQKPPRPRTDWVIGLDFGTTYSGFAYARASDDPLINVYYDWPRRGPEKVYCKTLTVMYYRREDEGSTRSPLECLTWGYPARSDYTDNRRHGDASRGVYLTKFKLLLMRGLDDPALAASIPAPFTAMSIVTDYLRLIGEHALTTVRNHHIGEFSRDSVQWVVTVPSIWDENAKQQMKACMVNAGLVGVGGIDAVMVVLEPEAASFHCHEILRQERKEFSLNTHDKILVADVGGGTADIVVQEMIGNNQTYQVQELTESSGGLCGGTYVDDEFLKFLYHKIPCLEDFLDENPVYKTRLLKDWEEIKCSFGHEGELMSDTDTKDINLHSKLAARWEAYEAARGNTLEDSSVVELTPQDLMSIFDPVVEDILSLIEAQLAQVPDIKVMFVVGGFAGSPYLMLRIRTRFRTSVTHIVSPPNPGSAIAQGAVYLALHPEAIVSRIAKKTYGTSVILPFQHGVDPENLLRITKGVEYCRNRFDVFVRKGERVAVDTCVTKPYVPHGGDQKLMLFDLWSSVEKEPRYAQDAPGVTKEGDFAVLLPKKYGVGVEAPTFDMSMFFGRSHIEMRAVHNAQDGKARSVLFPVKYCS